MKIASLGGLGLLVLGFAAFALVSRFDEPVPFALASPEAPPAPAVVTAADRLAGQPAPPFRAIASDGQVHESQDSARPLVLFFIKDRCPNNSSAQPHFRRLASTYGDVADFLGVTDGDAEAANRSASGSGGTFPVLADPDKQMIAAYGAERSSYVALVAPGGRVEKVWAGFSADMLRDLGNRLSRLADVEVRPIDVGGAPEKLFTGCEF